MFTNLMKEYAVNHITSSPYYPQSNGLAEKFVQIVKNLFYKANKEGVDINKYLMIYRNTLLHFQIPDADAATEISQISVTNV